MGRGLSSARLLRGPRGLVQGKTCMVKKRGHSYAKLSPCFRSGRYMKQVSQVEDRWLGAHGDGSAHS